MQSSPPRPPDNLVALPVNRRAGAGIALCTPPGPVGMGAMVCESAANGVTMQEMAIDPASMAENGVATQTISAPIVMPNG